MNHIEEIDAIMNGSPASSSVGRDHIAEIDAIMSGQPASSSQQKPEELSFLDKAAQIPRGLFRGIAAYSEAMGPGGGNLAAPYDASELDPSKAAATADKAFDKLYGKNLEPTDKWGEFRQGSGEFLNPTPLSLLPAGSVANTGLKSLLKLALSGAGAATGASGAINLTPSLTKEGSGGRIVEDLIKAIIGGGIGSSAGKVGDIFGNLSNIFKKSQNLTDAESRVAQYLQETLGKEGSATASENIKNAPQFPLTGYKPATAEVANVPLMSQLHRLREGIPGTGISEHAGTQNEAISNVVDKLSASKSTSQEIKDVVGSELSNRKAKRHSETNPLYTGLRKDKTQVDPVGLRSFLEEEGAIVKGEMKDDLEKISKLIRPSNQQTNIATVAELDQVRQNLVDKRKRLLKTGQVNRARQLKEAIKALDKDLEASPLQREATSRYAELSKPVNEILEHPVLSKLPESRTNEILSSMYNSSSYDNVVSLKKALKDRPESWRGFQDASIDYLMESIRNAGAEGKKNTLSYHKLNNFIKKHEKALQEVFTKDQLQLLEEIKNVTKGRNIASTLGLEKGSQTYGKLITGTHLSEGFGTKLAKGATYAPHFIPKLGSFAGEGLRMMLSRYMKTKESNVMSVVDKVLRDQEYAHKLITHNFKNQAEFNKEMNRVVKQLPSNLIKEKEQEGNDS